jgi:hypothetical protein
MGFLKRHFEKIALAVALLALIASVVVLTFHFDELKAKAKETLKQIGVKGAEVEKINIGPYTQAISILQQPVVWTNETEDAFQAGIPVIPVFTNFPSLGPRVRMVGASRKPFRLLFKSYTGTGQNFQTNFRDRTFFIAAVGDTIRDRYINTYYKIAKFQQKFAKVFDPNLGSDRDVDISVLTIQHPKEDPIDLTLGQVAFEKEWAASVSCPDRGGDFEIRRGLTFSCEGKTYNVVDISSDAMVIVDTQSGKESSLKRQ